MVVCMSRRICVELYEEPVDPYSEMHADSFYSAGRLTALFDSGYAELSINPGAKLCGAASFSLAGADGTPIERVYVNAIQDDAQIYKDLERTYYAALQQVKVREAVEAADVVHDMLDELRDDEAGDTRSDWASGAR